jgi:hypothetical protein
MYINVYYLEFTSSAEKCFSMNFWYKIYVSIQYVACQNIEGTKDCSNQNGMTF